MPNPRTVIIIIFVLIFGVQPLVKRMFNPTVYKGDWYTVTIPEQFEKKVEGDEVTFTSEDTDVFTGMPHAIFSIYTQKPKSPVWQDDLMAEVYESLQHAPGRILDKGEIKIDGKEANWVLFHNKEPSVLILSFYIVDSMNRFTKIQYISPVDHFRENRKHFEAFKDSIKFHGLFN